MVFLIAYLAVIASIVAWWLSKQGLTAKPWLEPGGFVDVRGAQAPSPPAAMIGLRVFFAAAGALFTLFITAYAMRLESGDQNLLPTPFVLWLNTAVLVLASVELQGAQISARRGQTQGVKTGLLAASVCGVAFLAGQLLAWRQLADAGYFVATNPASSFFYLLTAMHGLHVLGGLVALGRTTAKAWTLTAVGPTRLGVELCTSYWHFLLFVWVILFALLQHWTDDFILICRQLLN